MKDRNKAIMYVLISALGFAFMNLFVKLSGDLPTVQKVFFRNFVAVFCAFALVKKDGCGFVPPKTSWINIFLRSLIGGLGVLCNFWAIDRLVIADASMLNKLSPFFAIIFSLIMIKEKPKKYQIFCVVLAFVGALFILKPSFTNLISFPAFIGMVGGACAGFAYTNVRLATSKGAAKMQIVFIFSAFTCTMCLPGLILGYHHMTIAQTMSLVMAGVSATVGQFGITNAYALARAAEISVYDYSIIIFSAILGMLFLGEVPDIYSFVGYAVIIGAGVIMNIFARREIAAKKAEA